jgi:hypothetical protein
LCCLQTREARNDGNGEDTVAAAVPPFANKTGELYGQKVKKYGLSSDELREVAEEKLAYLYKR